MTMKIQKGDIVVCKNKDIDNRLEEGKKYTVRSAGHYFLKLDEIKGSYCKDRFFPSYRDGILVASIPTTMNTLRIYDKEGVAYLRYGSFEGLYEDCGKHFTSRSEKKAIELAFMLIEHHKLSFAPLSDPKKGEIWEDTNGYRYLVIPGEKGDLDLLDLSSYRSMKFWSFERGFLVSGFKPRPSKTLVIGDIKGGFVIA